MADHDITTRVCTACNEQLPIETFYFRKKGGTARIWQCKACCKKKSQAWHAENKEHRRERWMDWVRANPERFAATQKRYKDANRDEVRAKQRKYVAENKDAILERSRLQYQQRKAVHRKHVYAWRDRNRDATRASNANYRARKASAEGSHTKDDVLLLLNLQKGRCAYCGCSLKSGYHVDHVTPLFLGGSNGRDNLQLLCPSCNTKKSALDPLDYAKRIGRLL